MGPRTGAADGFQYVAGSLNGASPTVDDHQEFGSTPWSVAVIDEGSQRPSLSAL